MRLLGRRSGWAGPHDSLAGPTDPPLPPGARTGLAETVETRLPGSAPAAVSNEFGS